MQLSGTPEGICWSNNPCAPRVSPAEAAYAWLGERRRLNSKHQHRKREKLKTQPGVRECTTIVCERELEKVKEDLSDTSCVRTWATSVRFSGGVCYERQRADTWGRRSLVHNRYLTIFATCINSGNCHCKSGTVCVRVGWYPTFRFGGWMRQNRRHSSCILAGPRCLDKRQKTCYITKIWPFVTFKVDLESCKFQISSWQGAPQNFTIPYTES